jgi:hypothetical protein
MLPCIIKWLCSLMGKAVTRQPSSGASQLPEIPAFGIQECTRYRRKQWMHAHREDGTIYKYFYSVDRIHANREKVDYPLPCLGALVPVR